MIFQNYQDQLANAAQSLQSLVPLDLGYEYNNGWAILTSDNKNLVPLQTILAAEFTDDSNVATSIIEKGSFISYNKVPLPVQIVLTVVLDGMQSEQQQSIETLRKIKNSTDLVSVITPFETYSDMNITGLRYSRTVDRGASRSVIDLVLQEIRQVEVQTARMSKPSQVKNATATTKQNVGKVAAPTLSTVDTQKMRKALSDNVGGWIRGDA